MAEPGRRGTLIYLAQEHSPTELAVVFAIMVTYDTSSCVELFPSSPRRGGRDTNKISRSLLCGADGVVSKFQQKLLVFTHHRVCAS